ncbi:MAG: hypothetical protein ACK55Z_10075, partial [bacterium]
QSAPPLQGPLLPRVHLRHPLSQPERRLRPRPVLARSHFSLLSASPTPRGRVPPPLCPEMVRDSRPVPAHSSWMTP